MFINLQNKNGRRKEKEVASCTSIWDEGKKKAGKERATRRKGGSKGAKSKGLRSFFCRLDGSHPAA